MLSTYGKHPNYARCGDRFVVCAYTYRAWTPEEWRAPFGGSARRRKRPPAPSALSRRETWCASGSFAAARDDERIRAGKIQNVLDYIWKNLKDRLGKDAMREYRYYRGNAGRMKYDEYRSSGWFAGSGVIESGCKTVIVQRWTSPIRRSPKRCATRPAARAAFCSRRSTT